MGAYEYSALSAEGAEKKGIIEGDSIRQARQQLREQNLLPLRVEEIAQREKKHQRRTPLLRRGISVTDMALMTRQLATLVRSGTPLAQALATVARQTDKPRLKSLIMAVRSQVLEGHSLADGMARFPHIFDRLYVATVHSGEQSGHLDVVLERLAEYTESRQVLRQRVQLALIYPVILTVIAIGVVTALLVYVVPEVVAVFENTGQDLPLLTRALIASSDFVRAYLAPIIILISILILGVRQLLKNRRMRFRFHILLLGTPVVGKLIKGLNTERLARTLSILLASNVPLLEALAITGQVLDNLPMRKAVEKSGELVREGSSLASTLENDRFFPPLIVQLISSGEASGDLEKMLEHAAVSQERELQTLIAMLFGLLEPVLILVMGGVVLLIVLAIMLPIFELNQMVQ
jgi:general secretion pathway protein F